MTQSAYNQRILKIERLILGIAALSTVIINPNLINAYNAPKLSAFLGCVSAILIIFYLRKRKRLFIFPGNVLLVYISLFVLFGLTMSALFGPANLRQALLGTWGRNNGNLMYFSLLIFLLIAASLNSSSLSNRYLSWLSNLGGLLSIYGSFQIYGLDFMNYGGSAAANPLFLTLGNINFSSGFISMSMMATVVKIFSKLNNETSFDKGFVWYVLSFLIQLFVLFKAESTQGYVAFAIAFVLFIFLLGFRRMLSRTYTTLFGLISILTLILVSLGAFGVGPLSTLLASGKRSLQDRIYHWMAAWRMFQDNILVGVGIDSFGDFYRSYRLPESIAFRETASGFTNNAHNVFFQLASTGGLLLALPILLLTIATLFKGLHNSLFNEVRLDSIGVFAVWIAYQAQAFVSIEQLGIATWGWLAAGVCWHKIGLDSQGKEKRVIASKITLNSIQAVSLKKITNKKEFVQIPFLALAVASMVLSNVLLLIPAQMTEAKIKGQIILLSGPTSSKSLEQSESASDVAVSLLQLGLSTKNPDLRFTIISELLASGFVDEALKLSLATTREFPRSWDAWDAVAFISENTGREELAISARKRQFALDPLNLTLKRIVDQG